jgi:hypothetical protein
MINVNDRFEFKYDGIQWVLDEWRDGVNPKNGEPTRTKKTTYHASLKQVCSSVLNRMLGDCEDMKELIHLLEFSGGVIRTLVEECQKKSDSLKSTI